MTDQINSYEIKQKARGFGALEGSARGPRNINKRLSLIDGLVPLEGRRLLDIGCGNGAYTTTMAPRFERVDAIDLEPVRLANFRESGPPENVHIAQMSADDLDFEDGVFDRITAIEVMEHVANLQAVLRESHRVLRPGGFLAITTPNRLWPFEQHGYRFSTRRYPGWTFPGLTWIPPVHRRLSNADAFTRKRLSVALNQAGFQPYGSAAMFPALDRFEQGHPLHWITDALEPTPAGIMAQTLVVVARRA